MAAKSVNPLVGQLLTEMEKRNVNIPAFSKETKIPKDRIYKWKQEGTAPKEEDAKRIKEWLKMEKSPNEQLLQEENFSKLRGLVIERLTQIEANLRALNSTVIEIKHKVTGESVTKISLELEQTSRAVADMIYDELIKKI